MKRIVVIILVVAALAGIAFGLVKFFKKTPAPIPVVLEQKFPVEKVIGKSVEGRDITAYTYGKGEKHLVFVGGMHGGYEWNSVLLSYEFMDYLKSNPEFITSNLMVTVIPSLNPDAVFKVTGKEGRFSASDVSTNKELLASARFNVHDVDLNRNFDCKWKPTSMWQNKTVSAGTKAFSEPESQALKNFVDANKPDAFVFWHSAANTVYASECENGILPQTLDIMDAYAKAAKYNEVKKFDSYEVTGDAEGWLASINIPAITVELKTHETVEWEQNLAGIKALFKYYSQ